MDKETVLKVENVHKKYCRNLKKSLWYGMRDIADDLTGRSKDQYNLRPGEFWALQDINFVLKKGESIGLIGRNGAGKTTLLKLINGLLKPTVGKITIHGTIGALIALGTGFNPILTGRENVMIAGAVLGFTGKQMESMLDEILDFSEIGEFIDSPVKNYSSGMLVRLGFSVAIQLNPDLLLVDEVLAVGDLAFAIKCMKKITNYRNNGGSLVLVSHGMHNVRFHCDRAILLDQARIRKEGISSEVCDEYEMFSARQGETEGKKVFCDDLVKLGSVNLPSALSSDDPFVFEIEFITERRIEKPVLVFSIYDVKNQHLISNYSQIDGHMVPFEKGTNKVFIAYDNLPLANGVYRINTMLSEYEVNNHLVKLDGCYRFEIRNKNSTFGIMSLRPKWETIFTS
jgi:lipopolysaccharide transport system ATP-binding protein